MRRAIVGVFLVAFCLSGLACQQNPNAGATAPVPPRGSMQGRLQKGVYPLPTGQAAKPE